VTGVLTSALPIYLKGGTNSLRKTVAKLDVLDLATAKPQSVIPRDQVFYRLRLAGLEAREFRLTGAGFTTVVMGQQTVTREALLRAAEQAVRQRLPISAEDIRIRLTRAFAVPVVEVKPGDSVRLMGEIGSAFPVGKVRVEVGVVVGGERKSAASVLLEVAYRQEVAVARRRILPTELLQEDFLAAEKQLVDGNETFLTVAECLGRKAKGPIMAGQRVTDADVDSTLKEEPILIKSRESVRLVARVGALRVTALGEALQDGRAGQCIRCRNVDSNKMVSGRVVAAGQVEIEY
jgi:flagella basal body P-ring formation protein FlgA